MITSEKSQLVEEIDLLKEEIRDSEELALESVRKFVATVNRIVVDVRDDDLRREIIDSGVKMAEQLIDASSALGGKDRDRRKRPVAGPGRGTLSRPAGTRCRRVGPV